jgi:hypothetical protein
MTACLLILQTSHSFAQSGDVVISSDISWASGTYNLNSLTVTNNAKLTLQSASGHGVTISAPSIQVDSGSSISADGQGYGTGLGPGGSGPTNYATGGSYGGVGSNASASATYGSYLAPTDLGSGGGGMYGGWSAGGGAIRLIVSGTLANYGTITANGMTSVGGNTGGASGGSIYITAGMITGDGAITANGNQGSNAQGGGGRVAIYVTSNSGFGLLTTKADGGGANATAGSVYFLENNVNLYVPTNLVLPADTIASYDNISVFNGALFTLGGGSNITVSQDLLVTGASTILILSKNNTALVGGQWQGAGVTISANYMQIEAGSKISADGQGYGTGLGPGGSAGYATGGSHGGVGSGGGAARYGSYLAPTDLGSGGGGAYTGWSAGGGAIRLIVLGTLANSGIITANGMTSAGGNSGGGAGGSIYITADTIGNYGAITANGNQGSNAQGGGGRVAIYCTYGSTSDFTSVTADGGGANAEAGSVYILENSENLYVPTDLYLPADTTASYASISVFNGALFTLGGGSSITVNQTLTVTENSAILILSKNNTAQVGGQWQGVGVAIHASDIQIDAGSKISADGQGYGTGLGPGGTIDYASGGSYGGRGSGIYSASTYGSALAPTDLGSGGGGAYGGWSVGGGAIRLIISGTLTNNGIISANGMTSTGGNTGGASGGSIYITTDTIDGNGTITANGNQGNSASGGGGRIAIYYASNTFGGTITANRGGSSAGDGTVTLLSTISQITIGTTPVGRSFTVDGTPYTSTQTFSWNVGSSHTISTSTLQPGSAGTRYAFASWSDSGPLSHPITVPYGATTYTAAFTTQHQLTTAVLPPASGSVAASPSSPDGFYNSGLSVQLTASANGGYYFANWSGDLNGSANPQSLTMNAAKSATANFTTVVMTQITVGTSPVGRSFTVDGAVYTSQQTFSWVAGSSHTISTTTPQQITEARYAFADWSDGGAISHTITVPSSTTTYTADFTAQYQLTTSASPAAGGNVSASPASADGYYASGTLVQLTAIENSSYFFTIWSGDLAGTANPQTVTLSAPRSVTATFLLHGSSVNLDLSPGGAAVASTTGSGTTQIGYASLTVNSGATPYGTAVFTFRQNFVTVTEAGVPASPPTTLARVFIDWRSSVLAVPANANSGLININTGIAVVNTGATTANVNYTLRNTAGTILASGNGTIAAGAHFAKFIDQLTDVAPSFSLPSNFQNSVQFASLEISSDQPLSALALRGTNNQRNDFLITTTPIADLTQPLGNSFIYFPQFVDGGGYTTSLVLLNTSTAVETGTLEILDDNGVPLSVQPVGGTAGPSFRYSIQPNGAFRLQTDGFPTNFNKGWVRLTPDTGTSTPVGSGIFAYNPVDMLLSESGIPSAVSTTHARIYLDLSGSHNTGLAIANIASSNASIAINAFQMDGVTAVGTNQGSLPLAAYGHDAKFADQFISGLPTGFTGVLDIGSTTPFAALTIRSLLNERHDFLMTTFPIADANAAAPAPIVFPQVADGGGYVTQFIFISPSAASSATLSFWDETGAPLAIGN